MELHFINLKLDISYFPSLMGLLLQTYLILPLLEVLLLTLLKITLKLYSQSAAEIKKSARIKLLPP